MKLYIREWRQHRRLSQVKASKRAGIRQHTWSDLETGRTSRPHQVTLAAVARALRTGVDSLTRQP